MPFKVHTRYAPFTSGSEYTLRCEETFIPMTSAWSNSLPSLIFEKFSLIHAESPYPWQLDVHQDHSANWFR